MVLDGILCAASLKMMPDGTLYVAVVQQTETSFPETFSYVWNCPQQITHFVVSFVFSIQQC